MKNTELTLTAIVSSQASSEVAHGRAFVKNAGIVHENVKPAEALHAVSDTNRSHSARSDRSARQNSAAAAVSASIPLTDGWRPVPHCGQ